MAGRISVLIVLILVISMGIAGCGGHRVERQTLTTVLSIDDTDRDVSYIWAETAGWHEATKENIDFVGGLLEELDVDSRILSKEDQYRLAASLDTYLEQFGFYFTREPEKAERHCYWVAWLIAKGIKRARLSREEAEAVRKSYEDFVEEIVLDFNVRVMKQDGVDNYAKYVETINKCSQRLRDNLKKYYTDLHDDFLFPAFKKPLTDEIREYVLDIDREACEVESIDYYDRDPDEQKRRYIRQFDFYPNTAKLVAYNITLRTIWKEYHKTPEWGYMDAMATSCNPTQGKWPIDIRFSPNHGFNREAAKEGTL